jgi:hypothetical protein
MIRALLTDRQNEMPGPREHLSRLVRGAGSEITALCQQNFARENQHIRCQGRRLMSDLVFIQWQQILNTLTRDARSAQSFLDRRLRFTSAVAAALTQGSVGNNLVYGVWLVGHSTPIYVGQTLEGRRRLWDLPIGESHHLSNSFPPEIWARVVIVNWSEVLDEAPPISLGDKLFELGVSPNDHNHALGLAFEYLLQSAFKPLFNQRKKNRDGTWRQVQLEQSKSLGARVAPHADEAFGRVRSRWTVLSDLQPNDNAAASIVLPYGRVVFPSRLGFTGP